MIPPEQPIDFRHNQLTPTFFEIDFMSKKLGMCNFVYVKMTRLGTWREIRS